MKKGEDGKNTKAEENDENTYKVKVIVEAA